MTANLRALLVPWLGFCIAVIVSGSIDRMMSYAAWFVYFRVVVLSAWGLTLAIQLDRLCRDLTKSETPKSKQWD